MYCRAASYFEAKLCLASERIVASGGEGCTLLLPPSCGLLLGFGLIVDMLLSTLERLSIGGDGRIQNNVNGMNRVDGSDSDPLDTCFKFVRPDMNLFT